MPILQALEPEPLPELPPRPQRRLKAWVSVGVLLTLVVLAFGVLHILNTPAQGIITEHAVQATGQQNTQQILVSGKTVTFRYPTSIQKTKPDILAVGDVEKFLFVRPQLSAWSLAIQIRQLPSGVLEDDGGYNLRKQHPELYEEQKSIINGMSVSVMSDKRNADKVAFIVHNKLVASIAVSGDDTQNASTDNVFSGVLSSWQWL
jgi:hypothetical protein